MSLFRRTTFLSEIIEESDKNKVVIFKFSSECNSSSALRKKIEEIQNVKEILPIFLVTVQTEPVLSRNIAEHFGIKHESPQIITVEKGKVLHTSHHSLIKIEDFTS